MQFQPATWRQLAVVTCAALAIVIGHATPTRAAVPVPDDRVPGQKYHLIFNSTLGIEGTSGSIGLYNLLVQSAANTEGIGANAGVTWKALVSTPTVNARNNAVVGASTPVYNMNLERVANNFADFWDGTLAATIAYDEAGVGNPVPAWTGSNSNGLGATGLTLGADPMGMARAGAPVFTTASWIAFENPSTASLLSVYGLSNELTVAGSDFDLDGDTDGNDVLLWQRGLGTTRIAADLEAIKANFGQGYDQFTAVPEPGAAFSALLAMAILSRCRRGI